MKQLHHDQPAAILFDQLAQPDQVLVMAVGERAKLVLEARDTVWTGVAQLLGGHVLTRAQVDRLVHRAEAPCAQRPQDS